MKAFIVFLARTDHQVHLKFVCNFFVVPDDAIHKIAITLSIPIVHRCSAHPAGCDGVGEEIPAVIEYWLLVPKLIIKGIVKRTLYRKALHWTHDTVKPADHFVLFDCPFSGI